MAISPGPRGVENTPKTHHIIPDTFLVPSRIRNGVFSRDSAETPFRDDPGVHPEYPLLPAPGEVQEGLAGLKHPQNTLKHPLQYGFDRLFT